MTTGKGYTFLWLNVQLMAEVPVFIVKSPGRGLELVVRSQGGHCEGSPRFPQE